MEDHSLSVSLQKEGILVALRFGQLWIKLLLPYISAVGWVIYRPSPALLLVSCLPQHTYGSLCRSTQTLGFSCYAVWGKDLTSFPQWLVYCFEPRQAIPSFSTGFKWFFYESWGYQKSPKPKMLWNRKLLQYWRAAGLPPDFMWQATVKTQVWTSHKNLPSGCVWGVDKVKMNFLFNLGSLPRYLICILK